MEKTLNAVSTGCRVGEWAHTDRLGENQAVELVYSTPRPPYAQGNVWGSALEEGGEDMGLNVGGRVAHAGWARRAGYLLNCW